MDNRKILIILIFSIIGITIFSDIVNSCHLGQQTCYTDSGCRNQYSGSCYDWYWDFGDCQVGFAIGQYYIFKGMYVCNGPEAKWSTSGSNGQICKVRWGWNCGSEFEGKYDASRNICVKCEGKKKVEGYICYNGVGSRVSLGYCESACGADSCCDDVTPSSYVYSSACKGFCNSNCGFTSWSVSITSSATKVKVGNSVTITATSSISVDSSQGYYLDILEGSTIVQTCNSGTTCSYTVSKSSTGSYNYRARVRHTSLGEIASSSAITVSWVQCLSDNDCERGYRCDTSSGKCYTSCDADAQCKSGYYCYCGACSSSWDNGNCGTDKCCNKRIEYFGVLKGMCVDLETRYTSGSISYICARS
ncbi:MAG: hypothetical protein QXI09_02275 [Candidatus Aenigmatarchaeota archaeon]